MYIKCYNNCYKRFFQYFVNRNPHIFPQKTHVVEKNEINTAIVTQT